MKLPPSSPCPDQRHLGRAGQDDSAFCLQESHLCLAMRGGWNCSCWDQKPSTPQNQCSELLTANCPFIWIRKWDSEKVTCLQQPNQ